MIAAMLLVQAAAGATTPGGEAERLGLALARQGTVATLLPLIGAKETEEMVAAHPELDAAGKAELRRTAAATLAAGTERLMAATGREYARRLSLAELRALVRLNATPAMARYRAVQPQVIAGTMASIGTLDFKGDTLKAFCARTGKACPR